DTFDVGTMPTAGGVTDFNEDGNLDIVSMGSTYLTVHYGDGDGNFAFGSTINSSVGTYQHMEIGDFNNDGFTDIFAAGGTAPKMQVLMGNGNGTFNSSTIASIATPTWITTSDLNEDGFDDVL